MATSTQQPVVQQQSSENALNLKDLYVLCISHWWWFLLSVVLCVSLTFAKLLMTPNVYTRSASILIKDDRNSSSISGRMASGSFDMFNPVSDAQNELISMQSPAVMLEIVKRLHLDYNYTIDGTFHDITIYGSTLPIEASVSGLDDNQFMSFDIQLNGDKVSLSNIETYIDGDEVEDEKNYKGNLGDSIQTAYGNIVIRQSAYGTGKENGLIHVTRVGLNNALAAVKTNMVAALHDKQSSVIDLTYQDVNIQRAEEIINTLIAVYNENWVKDKNQMALSTSDFIGERLQVIEKELGNVDSDISTYKSDNLLPDVQMVSTMAMTEAATSNSQIRDLNNQLYMVRYVRSYVQKEESKSQLLPLNSGIGNASIESEIGEYNKLVLQRNSLVANSSESNPLVLDIDAQMSGMRQSILGSLDRAANSLSEQISSQQQNVAVNTNKIARNPVQAKNLLSVERQQKVKESLYLFLLQKREENELSQAFTAYNTRLITPPMGSNRPTSPQRMKILLIAFVVGLCIPLAILYFMEVNNTKIRGRKDLEKLTVPQLGEIPLYVSRKKLTAADKEKCRLVVKPKSRSIINEAFRVVRTNLEFMTQSIEGQQKVIMVTSSNPGSGKSFLSANIGASLGVMGKKVVVIDLDLRRSTTSSMIGTPDRGITNYLTGQEQECPIYSVPDHDNLFVIPVGTVPPNPTELVLSSRLKELVDQLREKYDYVIVDCPPVDIVADASIVAKWADMCVFVIRAELFERDLLHIVESYYKDKKFKNMAVLLNGTTRAHGSYGYGRYGYGYGYGKYAGYAEKD